MYTYAYGSNLSINYMRDYCPGVKFVMRAQLPNYQIEFRRYSTDLQGGISTIMEAPGKLVHGVIYNIPEAEIEALDILEDIPLGLYKRERFLVLDEVGTWQPADLYRVVTPEGPFTPSPQYIELMIEGATEHELAPHYVEWLTSLQPPESTDTESSDSESTGTESTDTESTDTESTDTESTDTEQLYRQHK